MHKFATAWLAAVTFAVAAASASMTVEQHRADDHLHHMHLPLIHSVTATHTAVDDGSWFSPSSWSAGEVPGDGAQVVIPAGTAIVYDGLSNARIDTVNVAGSLAFATDQSSSLVVDTLYVDPGGELEIGREQNPIAASVSVDITIANNGDIDVGQDPSLLSRGVVAFGRLTMHGARKTTHVKLAADPRAGDTSLQLANAPDNWDVGDRLVLTGTRYSGWKWDNDIRMVRYHGTQDEVLTITTISGATIGVSPALQYDHTTPRADLKASVANFSRNITIATEDPQTAQVHQRGHVVAMHHDDVDVRHVAFEQLGRTDKSRPSFEVAELASVESDSNVRGRYPFHVHRSGIDTPESPAIAIGLAVFNSPGWGITHHDSNMIVHNSATFDTFGAGIVAETGNEIGSWTNNIAIRAEGNSAFNPKNGNQREEFDMGRSGAGFWFQGRMVRSVGNIAASVNHGYAYLHRGSGMLPFPASAFMLPEALRRDRLNGPDDAPIFNFHNNEAFASTVGFYVVKANPNQQHDIRTHMSNFTGWEVRAGAAMEYTSHYLLTDFDLIASTPEPFREPLFGIDFGTNTSDMTINRAQLNGFALGVGLAKDFTDDGIPPEANQYVLIDISYDNIQQQLQDYDPNIDQLLTASDLSNSWQVNLEPNAYQYDSPATSAGSGVNYTGIKEDSIGMTTIPAGTDNLGTSVFDMIAICEQDGYRIDTATGDHYVIVEEYFSDRASGQIEKTAVITRLGSAVVDAINNQFTAWAGCTNAGPINLASAMPIASDDNAETSPDTPIDINVLANDSDSDGDPLTVDGVIQPRHGFVFPQVNGNLRYEPDFDFVGSDQFDYWATDNHGNYHRARVFINVVSPASDAIFEDGFEG